MVYLNSTAVTANLNYSGAGNGPSLTRHVASYTDRRVIWFKGVDNQLEITISGSDRRSLNVINREIVLTLWDRVLGTVIFRRRTIPMQAERGQVKLVVFARDLMTVASGFYSLGATMVDENGLEVALAWDRSGRAEFDVEIKDAPIPTSRYTEIVDHWLLSDGKLVSSAIKGPYLLHKDSALFTVACYANNYTGVVTVQATQDDVVDGISTLWTDLRPQDACDSVLMFNGYTGIVPYNYYAGVKWIRTIKKNAPANVGTLDKILIRV